MRDKKTILLSLLISVAMLVEGWALMSKPKIILVQEGDSFPLEKSETEQRKLSPSLSVKIIFGLEKNAHP